MELAHRVVFLLFGLFECCWVGLGDQESFRPAVGEHLLATGWQQQPKEGRLRYFYPYALIEKKLEEILKAEGLPVVAGVLQGRLADDELLVEAENELRQINVLGVQNDAKVLHLEGHCDYLDGELSVLVLHGVLVEAIHDADDEPIGVSHEEQLRFGGWNGCFNDFGYEAIPHELVDEANDAQVVDDVMVVHDEDAVLHVIDYFRDFLKNFDEDARAYARPNAQDARVHFKLHDADGVNDVLSVLLA